MTHPGFPGMAQVFPIGTRHFEPHPLVMPGPDRHFFPGGIPLFNIGEPTPATDPERGAVASALEISNLRASLKASEQRVVALETQLEIHKAKEATYYKLAHTDKLTGIGNRLYLQEKYDALTSTRGSRESDRRRATSRLLSGFILDIDHFKHFNDDFGHDEGDEVLAGVARLAGSALRERDIFGRLGGEEFAGFFPRVNLHIAAAIAEKVRRRIENTPIGPHQRNVTVSIGVAQMMVAEADSPTLEVGAALRLADYALYQAKGTDENGGRNRVITYYEDHLPEVA